MPFLNEEGKQYHINCKEGDVGRYVLLPGDPFRTDVIASMFDDAKLRNGTEADDNGCYKKDNIRYIKGLFSTGL